MIKKQCRWTKQKKIILEELCKLHSHPTAKELYRIVKIKLPSIGLATVYRSLEFFVKTKVILKLQTKDKEAHYDGNIKGHAHLICKKCGEIIDICDVEKVEIKSQKLKESKFKVCFDCLELHGLCKNCH